LDFPLTVTSNIHIGLSAWTNHTFTLNERCSTGGNAYQCTTAGTSTSAPTGTGSSINNGGVAVFKWLSAITYSTLSAWVAGIPATLTQPIVGQLWNNSAITTAAGTAYLTLSGHTTSGTNTITLTCAPGESFRDKLVLQGTALNASQSNGVLFQLPASAGGINYFDITDANVIFNGLQFQDPDSTSNCTIINTNSGASGFKLRNCIIDGYAQTGGAYIVAIGDAATLANCLIIDREAANANNIPIVFTAGTSVMANCTLVAINSQSTACATTNTNTGVASLTITNTIATGYNGFSIAAGVSGGTTVNHSATSSTTVGTNSTNGTGNLFSKTAASQFVSSTTDFRLIGTGASAYDAGATDTTDIPTADDIAGTARPQSSSWDIGAWEFKAATSVATTTGTSSSSYIGNATAASPATATGTSSSSYIAADLDTSVATAVGSSATSFVGSYVNVIIGAGTGTAWGVALINAQSQSEGRGVAAATGSALLSFQASQAKFTAAAASAGSTAQATGIMGDLATGTTIGSSTAGFAGSSLFHRRPTMVRVSIT
jgi:hypothetical protein